MKKLCLKVMRCQDLDDCKYYDENNGIDWCHKENRELDLDNYDIPDWCPLPKWEDSDA